MTDRTTGGTPNFPDLGRRKLLMRLGLGALAAYTAPLIVQIGDEAAAADGAPPSSEVSSQRRRRGRATSWSDRRRRRRRRISWSDRRRRRRRRIRRRFDT